MSVTVYESRWGDYIKRLLGLRAPLALGVLDDVFPVLPLFDPAATELLRMRGERAWVASGSVTSAAGQLPRLKLQVDGVTSILSTIDYVLVSNSVADRVRILTEPFAAAGGNGARSRDLRDGTGPGVRVGTLFLLDAPGGLGGNDMGNVQLQAGVTQEIRPGLVIAPGTQVNFIMTVAGVQTMAISAFGRERSVDAGELR